mgnify:CR=1 FL=1
MKAVGITLHSVCNYGTQLQLFATQEKLKEYFDEVEFIDFRRKDTYGIGLLKTFTKGNILKAIIVFPTLLYWKKIFGEFQKQYISLSKRKYLKIEDFNNYCSDADIYFTGSDQVWNSGWNRGIIPPYYLNFIPKDKIKFSYAASFGMSCLAKSDIEKTKEYIREYNYISVREKSGVEILQKQYKYKNVVHIVDPTLIMEGDFWRRYAPKCRIKGDYILVYNLQRSKKFDQYANEISHRTGLKLYRFCTRFDQIVRNGKSIIIPNIFEFVSLIDNARFVITDSFHATAFSMNLNTEPICLYPSDYSGRISEFLELVEALDRHPDNYNDFSILNRHVNFKVVNAVLEKKRKEADIFLENVVSLAKDK